MLNSVLPLFFHIFVPLHLEDQVVVQGYQLTDCGPGRTQLYLVRFILGINALP